MKKQPIIIDAEVVPPNVIAEIGDQLQSFAQTFYPRDSTALPRMHLVAVAAVENRNEAVSPNALLWALYVAPYTIWYREVGAHEEAYAALAETGWGAVRRNHEQAKRRFMRRAARFAAKYEKGRLPIIGTWRTFRRHYAWLKANVANLGPMYRETYYTQAAAQLYASCF